jgi:hypothetical protein
MNWQRDLAEMEADTSDTPMDACQNCGDDGGFVIIIDDYRERWVDCPACGGSGWVEA